MKFIHQPTPLARPLVPRLSVAMGLIVSVKAGGELVRIMAGLGSG